MTNEFSLSNIHKQLGHPGISRLSHFVRTKNLPFLVEDVKNVCKSCQVCAEIKPRFYEKPKEKLIKAMRPWERISIDFKGPLDGRNKYALFVIDEFSRYPFAFPCRDITTATVVSHLTTLFFYVWLSIICTQRSRLFFHVKKTSRISDNQRYCHK